MGAREGLLPGQLACLVQLAVQSWLPEQLACVLSFPPDADAVEGQLEALIKKGYARRSSDGLVTATPAGKSELRTSALTAPPCCSVEPPRPPPPDRVQVLGPRQVGYNGADTWTTAAALCAQKAAEAAALPPGFWAFLDAADWRVLSATAFTSLQR